jgi:hypothetical protein
VLITPSAWGSQLPGHNHHQLHASHQFFSGAVAGEEKEDLCKGSFSHAHPLLCYCFTLLYFYLCRFIKNTKKLVPTIVVIFVGLLLSCFIMLSINGWFL